MNIIVKFFVEKYKDLDTYILRHIYYVLYILSYIAACCKWGVMLDVFNYT